MNTDAKKALWITVAVIAAILILYRPYVSYYQLKEPMSAVMRSDSRNKGIDVDVYFGGFWGSETLVYDLQSVEPQKSMIDVIRVLFQYAEAVQERDFKKVVLAYKGEDKFWIKGDYFNRLGKNYATDTGTRSIETFPQNVYEMEGTQAFPSWTGNWIRVTSKQLSDFQTFNRRWYADEITKR